MVRNEPTTCTTTDINCHCYLVGGIDAHLCNQPSLLIPFSPVESHIQGFTCTESNQHFQDKIAASPQLSKFNH